MKTVINDQITIGNIQEVFRKQFPYLRLEFFVFKEGEKRIFSKKNLLTDSGKTIGSIRNTHKKGLISFNGKQKVSTLEKGFLEGFGLYVQVFRKSGNQWLETSTSDNTTLSEQNRLGLETTLSKGKEVPPDYDLYHEQL